MLPSVSKQLRRNLPHIIDRHHFIRPLPDGSIDRHRDGREHHDNPDDHQHFDERKSPAIPPLDR